MNAGPRVSAPDATLVRSCLTCGALLDRVHLEESPDGLRCVFCGALQDSATAEEPRGPAPTGVGDTFCKAREARRESLEHAASETHINERFLRALEEDAPSDVYPGAIYGRFFVREYAEHLGLDAEPLLKSYDRAGREEEIGPVPDIGFPKDHTRRNRLVTAIAIVALMVVAGFSWWARARPEAAADAHASVFSAASSPAARVLPASPDDEGRTPPTSNLRVIVRLVAPCWIRAIVDGRALQGRTWEAGTERIFRADRSLELTFGNAGGARVWVDGERMRTGASGQVVHLSLMWRHGHVVGSPT